MNKQRAILITLRDAAEAELNGAEVHRLIPPVGFGVAPAPPSAAVTQSPAPRAEITGPIAAPPGTKPANADAAQSAPATGHTFTAKTESSAPTVTEQSTLQTPLKTPFLTPPQTPFLPHLPTMDPVAAAVVDPGAAVWATPIPMLRLRNFAVSVAGRSVLSNVNLDLADCGLHVLVGPDDTQRRTFLRALCGPRGSHLELQGQFLFGGASLTKEQGLAIPSTDPRHALLTVRDYLTSRPTPWQTGRESAAGVADRIEQAGFPELARRLDVAFCELETYERRVIEILALSATQPLVMVLHDVLHGVPATIRPRILDLLAREAVAHAILLCTDQPDPYRAYPFTPPLRIAYFNDQGIRAASSSGEAHPGPEGAAAKPAR